MLVWACFPEQHKKKWLKWKGSRNKSVCHLMICRVITVQSRRDSIERGYSPDLCLFCNLIVSGRNQEGVLIQKAYGALNCNSFIRQATNSRLMERVSTGLSSSIRRGISAYVTGLLSCCQAPLDPPSLILFSTHLGSYLEGRWLDVLIWEQQRVSINSCWTSSWRPHLALNRPAKDWGLVPQCEPGIWP